MTEELVNFQHLITSNGWKQYLLLLKEHQQYLQKEVNRFVREKNLEDAYAGLAKLEDIDNQLRLLYKKIDDLKKEGSDGQRR